MGDGLPTVERFTGALLGGAIGDALGRPHEGRHRFSVRLELPLAYGGHHLGSITDDTDQTMIVGESLLAVGWLDPEDIARRLVAWLPHGTGKGTATVHAVVRLQEGVPWYAAGEDSAGNGAAMRAAPIGLWWYDEPTRLKSDAVLLSLPTHRHPTGVAGAVALASAVAHLVMTEPDEFTTASFVEVMADALEGLEPERVRERRDEQSFTTLRERILEMPELLRLDPDEALLHRIWTGAFVLESLPAALYCFLASPNDFRATLALAITAGHDTDTVGAFAGTMYGALYGVGALPDDLLEGLAVRD